MKKIKKRQAAAGAVEAGAAVRRKADEAIAGRTAAAVIAKAKKPKRKATEDDDGEGTVYEVRVYGPGIVKWGDKQGTRIISAENGLLIFGHRKPRTAKILKKPVVLERVQQFGGDGETGWVHLYAPRVLTDRFRAVGIKRTGKFITFDMGDGLSASVNADADIEVVSIE
jgi:hypothetical protein